MLKHQVRSPGDALAYITDCTLATVCELAGKKSASKSELRRQISIAQTAIDWMNEMHVDYSSTRAQQVKDGDGLVATWAEQYRR